MRTRRTEEPSVGILSQGHTEAPVLVICDAPPDKSYREGSLMSGPSMRRFAQEAEAAGFSQSDFSFIIPCPPVPEGDKGSDSRESKFLEGSQAEFDAKIREYNPKIVVILGKMAGKQFTRRAVKITKVRGQLVKVNDWNTPVFAMLSPAHVLRRPELDDVFKSDFGLFSFLRDSDWDGSKLDEAQEGSKYVWVKDFDEWIDNRPKALFTDTEFKELRWYSDRHWPICIQLTDTEGHAYCAPLSYDYAQAHSMRYTRRSIQRIRDQVKILMEDPEIAKAGFNFKIDLHVLENIGIYVKNWYVDAQMLAFAMDENMMTKSQSECVRRWVPEMSGYSDSFDAKYDKGNMETVPANDMLKYGGGDVDSGIRLVKTLSKEVKKDLRQWTCLMKIQMPALRCFQQMERKGLAIRTNELANLQEELEAAEVEKYDSLIRQVPAEIKRKHLNMPNQKNKDPKDILSFGRDSFVKDILFSEDGLELEPVVWTKGTRKLPMADRVPSVSSKDHLPFFKDEELFVGELIEYVKLQTVVSKYVGKPHDEKKGGPTGFWQYLEASHGDRIHPSFLLHRTVTGRTSSADPNAQNFPKRGKLAKAFRRIFAAPDGYRLIEVDLSQAELRVAAWMARENHMLGIYRNGGDIHATTAAAVMGLTMEQFNALDPELRDFKRFCAKAVNFGFLYGMGWRSFKAYAKTDYGLDFSDEEAQQMRKTFFCLYPKLEDWHNSMREFVRKHGYVRALHGAFRHLPNIHSNDEGIRGECERQAINSPVQRFASDLGLIGLTRFGRDVSWNTGYPIAFIHDSAVALAKIGHEREIAANIKWYMQTPPLYEWFGLEAPLPIVADASIGDNLADMEEIKGLEAVQPEWYQGHEDWVYGDRNWEKERLIVETAAC